MFETIKIITKCKSFLKKYNITFNDSLRIYKRKGLIHCQFDDWRGSVELDGFPVFTSRKATYLLLENALFNHFLNDQN